MDGPPHLFGLSVATVITVLLIIYAAFHYQMHASWQRADVRRAFVGLHSVDDRVALCIIVKDEFRLDDWVDHHFSLGVGQIYVYDNGSNPPANQTLAKHIADGRVWYQYFLDTPSNSLDRAPQFWVYDECLHRHGSSHTWMGLFDGDEYLVLAERDQSLGDFMTSYEEFGGLGVNWVLFGTSGNFGRPTGPVMGNYVDCLEADHPLNRHIKTIANTKYTLRIGNNPHYCDFVPGKYAVTPAKEPLTSHETTPGQRNVSQIALLHYSQKSYEDYAAKIKRGRADLRSESRDWSYFHEIEESATARCTQAWDYGYVDSPKPVGITAT